MEEPLEQDVPRGPFTRGPGAVHAYPGNCLVCVVGRRQQKGCTVPGSSGKGRGRRPREQKPREHVVKVKLSAAEKASMSAAAEREGLALAAYLGQAWTGPSTGPSRSRRCSRRC